MTPAGATRLPTRVALITMHTSPVAAPGGGDAGGMNVAVLRTAHELAARGVAVDLLTRGGAGERELAPGVTLRSLEAGLGLGKAQLAEATDAFGEAVAQLARARTYDVLHAHYWLSGIAVLPVALELGLPLVQSFHTVGVMKNAALAPGDAPEPERRLRSEAFLAAQADAVVAGSAAEATAIVEGLRAPAGKVWVVPPGVDAALFDPGRASVAGAALRARLAIDAEAPIVVVAGRIEPLKGQEFAIRVLGDLRRRRPDAAAPVLVIAGDVPERLGRAHLDALAALAIEQGVADRVRVAGLLEREALADLLATAAVTLMPSRSETFGLIALESAASGTPVLAADSTGLKESVADGVSGLLLPGFDPEVWADALAALLADGARLAALSASAREHARTFGWAGSAASLLAIYGSLLR